MARMGTAGILLFLRVFFLAVPGSYGTTINVSSEVLSAMPGIQSTPSSLLDGSMYAMDMSDPMPYIQSTSSIILDSSTSAVFPTQSLISDAVPGIQSTPSIILDSSTSAVVPTQSLISEACTPPGEYINASSGHISSLNISDNYEANRTCTWNITVLSGKIIKLTFLYFTLVAGENDDCAGAAPDSARVFITNVASHEGNPNDFKICGQNLPPPVYSKGNSIQVRFEFRSSTVVKGFKATFEAIDGDSLCPTDMILNETSGSFSSPFNPRNYPFNQKCSWKIIGKQGYRVELTIPDYNLQRCGSAACSCDYMEVQNSFSDEALPGKLCGTPRYGPLKFYSLHESLRVVFVSDDVNMDYDGFGATYKLLDYSPPICPNEAIPLSGSGKISSTNYPKSNYTASRNCTWNITAPVDKIVKFTFTDFVLSECSANPCSCSYVELYDGGSTTSRSLGRFCQGSFWHESQFSSGNQMFVMFHPGQNVDRGFEAKYECTTESPTTSSFSTTISVSSGVSSSVPDIQSTTSLLLDGSTSAVVPSPILISASESSFGTTVGVSSEVSSSVPDIQSTTSLLLDGSMSAVVPSPILISASESSFGTTISVSSEVSSSVPSIQSTSSIILNSPTPAVVPTQSPISEACTPPGEYINASSGHISSLNFPHNYEANRTCTWNITVLSGKIIKLTFLNFTLVADEEGDCTGAAADSARVFITNVASHDGNPDDFKICGQTLPHPVYSKGNSIQVRFESRNSILNKGFKATFEAIDGDSLCPTDMILDETSGSFSSPFYPRNYPFNQTCSWKIIGKQGYRVELTIPDYNLQPCGGAACSCDYMEVQNSFSDEALPGKLCAAPTTFPVKFYSLHESLRVVFVSDDANMGYYGFSATYKLLNYSPPICPKEAIPLSGSGKISSTNYPKSNYTASRNCNWNITAPADKIVKFTFTDFVLSECSASPCSDSCSYVELYDGGSTTTLLGRFCQSSSWNESQFSSGNQMFVMFHPGKTVDRGFEAKYESATTNAIPPASIMYPYGPQQEDNEFGLDDFPYYYSDLCLRINTDWTGIPFFSERLYKLYICRNGLIQLDFEWSWWWPRKFGIYWWLRNMGIIAPFWAITDTYLPFKYNHSKVYYQVYSQTQNKSSEILDLATRHVQDYIEGFGDFRANWVLVVTWEKLCPYSYYSYYYSNEQNFQLNCPRSNTFQAVLITNGFNAFLMYNYPSKGIQWLVKTDPEYYRYWTDFYGLPVAGWNAGNDGKNFVNLKGSGTFGLSDLDKEVGNTGLVGRHFWRIENSDGQGALEKCLSWVLQNKAWKFLERYNELIKSDSEMACPCTGWQAIFDWGRFRWNWWNSWPEFCFESRSFRSFKINTTSGPLDFQLRQKCCYSTDWQDWGSLKRGPPDGGRVDVTLRYDSNNSFYTDEQAYKSCCVDSLNCRLFYDLRPSDSCSNYVPRPRRWFWGDPHIKTLDGGNYTFNGLGEYTMVDAKNGTFKLQARTKLAQGNSTTATIFSAGAAKEENSSTIEVRVKDGGGFDILIDSASYDGYNNLTNQSVEVEGNLSFSKPKENCLQVSFLSTSSVQFCEKKEMMSFVVTLGNDFKNATKGLLGTWNGDPKDDFTLPNGTVLSSSSTLSEIHFHFGVKWQINQSQSLFTYANNESVATFSKLDFMPMFADNITWHNDSLRQRAEAQCGDDHECLFDVASTKDLSIGSATKEISVQLLNDTKKLNNFPPKIVNTSEVINVTLHEIVELNITAVDDGPITFRVINKPVGATWNQTGAVLLFYWNVTSSKKFSLTFVAVDDQDASAIWSPTIKMCACQHDGQCVEPEEGDANNTDSKFIYMSCECQGGYTGRFCDRDIDACEVNGQPCYAGVDCTDRPPPANSSGYICGPCPSGHTGDGAKCVDIDECQRSNPCKQKCVNVPASFFCDCDNGYKLNDDGRSCGDINECLPTNDCMQKCDNSVGSYNCSCDEYFKTDPTDWRKCVAKDPCTSDHGCSHVCFKGSSGRATCACYANFELQSDGKTCKDINECDPAKKLHRCSQTCINTEGSYKCSCTEGYELKEDGYECEDINECLNDDLYNCTDNFHKCVNTRGSYKCECEQDLYFIDGKCKGLEKNQEPPKQPPPKPKNASENEKEQAVQFSIPSRTEWDLNRDKNFKEVLASVASEFCRKNRTNCGLKNSRRKRRSLYDIYTADEVHLLPGYPKNSSDSLQVAFYVKQPAGGFIGNNSVLHRDTLVAIIIAYKSDIEKAIGANITDIETLFKPSTTTESPTAGPAEPADDDWKWIVIGVVIGVVVIIILIGLLIFCIRKRKRDVKPITDPSQEGIAAQQSGLKKENSFESGSHSA